MVNFFESGLVFLAFMLFVNVVNAAEQANTGVASENNSAFCYYKNEKYSEGAKIPELKGRICKKPNFILKEDDKDKLIWEVDNDSKAPSRR